MKKLLILLFSLSSIMGIYAMNFDEQGSKKVVVALELKNEALYELSNDKVQLCQALVNAYEALEEDDENPIPLAQFELSFFIHIDSLLTHYLYNNKKIDFSFIANNFNEGQVIALLNALNFLGAEDVLVQLADFYAQYCITQYEENGIAYFFSPENDNKLPNEINNMVAIKLAQRLGVAQKIRKPFLIDSKFFTNNNLKNCEISSNGCMAIATRYDEPLTIYDLTCIERGPLLTWKNTSYSFCNNNQIALYNDKKIQLEIKSLTNQRTLERIAIKDEGKILKVIVSPNEYLYAVQTKENVSIYAKDGSLRLYKDDIRNGKMIPKMVFAQNSSRLVYGYWNEDDEINVHVISFANDAIELQQYSLNIQHLSKIAFSPCGNYLVIYSYIDHAVEVISCTDTDFKPKVLYLSTYNQSETCLNYLQFTEIVFINNSQRAEEYECWLVTPLYHNSSNCYLINLLSNTLISQDNELLKESDYDNVIFNIKLENSVMQEASHRFCSVISPYSGKFYKTQLRVWSQFNVPLEKLTIEQMVLVNEVLKKKPTIHIDHIGCSRHKNDTISNIFAALKETEFALYNELCRILPVKRCDKFCTSSRLNIFLKKMGSFGLGALIGGGLGYLGVKHYDSSRDNYPLTLGISAFIGGLAGMKLFSRVSALFR